MNSKIMNSIRHFKKSDVKVSYYCSETNILATVEIDGVWISNPTITQFLEDGWEEYTEPAIEPTREEKIHEEIRLKYTDNDEYMILRHYLSDPENETYKVEFEEYDEYVESVIAKYPEEND